MLHGLMVRVRATDPELLDRCGLGWLIEPFAESLEAFIRRDDYMMWEALKAVATGLTGDSLACRLAEDLLTDRRWDGMVCEGESVDAPRWEDEVFVAPYKRAGFYDLGLEDEVLVVGQHGVRPLSDDPRVLQLAYAEPAAYIRIRPPDTAARVLV
ncbi:MAG: hypothetical protein FJZ00_03370 [Candidatus Sericytochromatia bacterium]|uniref:Uncharacterized protein n=1 Tax=Candidatus Tanganyikabacteria bacterium TaxID=2961651 RepID=A0A937X1B0_9BACT|nr:hypothetical protein [Candidatus Tanganyikabacteria bacterium]